jgi:predicted hotdog family 3-hydroxylacyl-ACP dehydratase
MRVASADASLADVSVARLVPHRGPALLIDRVLAAGPEDVRVEARVRRDGLYATDDGLPAWVGLELMAQAIAVWAGLRRRERGEPPGLGFLTGTRRFDAAVASFPHGATLHVTARCELVGDNGLGVFACAVELDGRVVATANLSTYAPPEGLGAADG